MAAEYTKLKEIKQKCNAELVVKKLFEMEPLDMIKHLRVRIEENITFHMHLSYLTSFCFIPYSVEICFDFILIQIW